MMFNSRNKLYLAFDNSCDTSGTDQLEKINKYDNFIIATDNYSIYVKTGFIMTN